MCLGTIWTGLSNRAVDQVIRSVSNKVGHILKSPYCGKLHFLTHLAAVLVYQCHFRCKTRMGHIMDHFEFLDQSNKISIWPQLCTGHAKPWVPDQWYGKYIIVLWENIQGWLYISSFIERYLLANSQRDTTLCTYASRHNHQCPTLSSWW